MSKLSEETDEDYCRLAVEAAERAGAVIRAALLRTKRVSIKHSDSVDLVTDTDVACERLIVDAIRQRYPQHKFVAEESHQTPGRYDYGDEPTWIIDPVDGTTNLVHGLPLVSVSIGVMVRRQVRVGVIHVPFMHETFSAIVGKGAWLNGTTRVQTSGVPSFNQAAIAWEFGYLRDAPNVSLVVARLREMLLRRVHCIRSYGSAAINLAYIAAGRLDLYAEGVDPVRGPKPWDLAAGAVIVQEAGGVMRDIDGGPFSLWSGRLLSAASAQLADEFAQLNARARESVGLPALQTPQQQPRAKL